MSIDPLVENAVNRVRKELITRTDAISTSITNLPTLIPSDITKELTLVAGEDLIANQLVRLDSDGKVRRANNILAQADELPLSVNAFPLLCFKTQANNKIVVIYQDYSGSTAVRRDLFCSIYDSNLNLLTKANIPLPVQRGSGEAFSAIKSLGANNSVGISYSLGASGGVRFFSFVVNDSTNAITINSGVTITINASTHDHCVTSDSTGRYILVTASSSTSVAVATFDSNATQLGTTQTITTVRSGITTGVCAVAFDSASTAAYFIVSSASNTAKAIKLTYQTDAYKISGSQVTLTGSINNSYLQDNRWAVIYNNKIFTEYSQGSGQFSLVAVDITGGTIGTTAQILQNIVPYVNGLALARGREPFIASNKLYFIDKTSNALIEIVSSVGSISTNVLGKVSTAYAKSIYMVDSTTVYASAQVFNLGTDLVFLDYVNIPWDTNITNNMGSECLITVFRNINDLTSKQHYEPIGYTRAITANNANATIDLLPEVAGVLQTKANSGKIVGTFEADGSVVLSATQSILPIKEKSQNSYLVRANANLAANSLVTLKENGAAYSTAIPESTALVTGFSVDGARLIFCFQLKSGNIFSLHQDNNFNNNNQLLFSITNETGNLLIRGLFAYTFSTSTYAYAFVNATGTNLFGMMAKANGATGTRQFALFNVNEARLQPFQSGNATSPIEQIGSVTSFIQTLDGPVSITYDPTRSLFIGVARGQGSSENPRVSTFNLSGVQVGTEQTISGFTGANNLNEVLGLEYDSLSDACYLVANGGASTSNLYVAKLTYQTDAFKLSGSVTTVTTPSGFASGGAYAVGYPSSTIVNQMIFCKRTSTNTDKVFAVSVAGGTINTTGFTLGTPNPTGMSVSAYGAYLCSTGKEVLLPFHSTPTGAGFFRICPVSLAVSVSPLNREFYPETSHPNIIKLANGKYILGFSSGATGGVTGRNLKLEIYTEDALLAPFNIPNIDYANKNKIIGVANSTTVAKNTALVRLDGVVNKEDNIGKRFASVSKQKVYLNDFLTLNKKIDYSRLRMKTSTGTTLSGGVDTTVLNIYGSRGGVVEYLVLNTSGSGAGQINNFKVTVDGNLEQTINTNTAMSTQATTSYYGNANVFPINLEFSDSITLKVQCNQSSIPYTLVYREEF